MSQTQRAVVANFMLFPDQIDAYAHAIDPAWFTGEYRKAFTYLCENGGGDIVSLASSCGIDAGEVAEWMDTEFISAFLPRHIDNLEKEAGLRKVKFLSSQLSKIEDMDEATRLIDRFQASLSATDKTEPVTMTKALAKFTKDLEEKHQRGGAILGVTTGLEDLDKKTEGLITGDLVIVAAPASMGKTALAIGMAESASFAGKGGVLFFSFEMKTEQVISRSASYHSRVPMGRIRSAKFQPEDWGRMMSAFEKLKGADMFLDDPSGLTLSQVINKIRRYAKKGVRYVFIDYLQIMNYDKDKENRELDVICCGLKGIAKELDVCVVLLSQLNRGNQKEKRKPTMHDLRGSGTIENHADVILLPWRESAQCDKCLEGVDNADHNLAGHQAKAEIIIGKQRQGERNVSIPVSWCGEQTRFYNMARREG